MNNKLVYQLLAALLGVALTATMSSLAQGNAFTYQGRLNDGGAPASGYYDLRFRLFSDALGNTQAGSDFTSNGVSVASGLFTVALDFGPGIFDGTSYWLEVGVKTNGAGAYVNLSPLQPVTPTPYAVFAENVKVGGLAAGTYTNAVTLNNTSNSFNGSFAGNGAGLTNVTAATLDGLSAGQFWKISGNSDTSPTNGNFLGTTDNQPLEVKVNGERVFRWERGTSSYDGSSLVVPNLIGGHESNRVEIDVAGATIAGGGGSNWFGPVPPQTVYHPFGTIGGGVGNVVIGAVSTVAGGERGYIAGFNSFLGGGARNSIESSDATLGGGRGNAIRPGASGAFLGGGGGNSIQTNAGYAFLGGGGGNSIQANAGYAFLGGGVNNSIQTNAAYAFLGSGRFNSINAPYATVPGGQSNTVAGPYSFAAGQRAKANHAGTFVWADSQFADFASTSSNQFLIRASSGVGINTTAPAVPLHIGVGSDLSLLGGGYLVNGPLSGLNLVIDNNEIMARSNSAVSPLFLNAMGGTVSIGIGTYDPSMALLCGGNAAKPGGGLWSVASDVRLKKNIRPLTGALGKLLALHGVNFEYIDPARIHELPGERMGLLAQEVEKVFPDWVEVGEDGYRRMTVRGLEAVLVEALRELHETQQASESKLAEQQSQEQKEIAKLHARLERLERLLGEKLNAETVR